MKEHPIIFSGPMVRAILADQKTQTRRIVRADCQGYEKLDIGGGGILYQGGMREQAWTKGGRWVRARYSPGDRLWVRENFFVQPMLELPLTHLQPVDYAADIRSRAQLEDWAQHPSIHMPRWASRITRSQPPPLSSPPPGCRPLEVTEVRVQRLQEISAAKASISASKMGHPALWRRRPTKEVGGVIMYRCGSCRHYLPRSDFYPTKRTLLGIRSQCRRCHGRSSVMSRDPENARRLNREHMARARGVDPAKFREREKAASRKRPKDVRVGARRVLNAAVRSGKVQRPEACDRCRRSCKPTAHHPDYSQPLEVIWLCSACHGLEHRKDAP